MNKPFHKSCLVFFYLIFQGKNLKKLFFFLPFLFVSLWLGWLLFFHEPTLPSEKNPLIFYAQENDANLEKLLLKAVDGTKNSLYLSLYSFNSEKLMRAINKKNSEGINIFIQHDPIATKSIHNYFKEAFPCREQKVSGLFHEKILISDGILGFLGSSNFTNESLIVDHNILLAFYSQKLSEACQSREKAEITIGKTTLFYFPLPEERIDALAFLLSCLQKSHSSLKAALFTFTHPEIIDALIHAKKRGVDITIFSDKKMLLGASKQAALKLLNKDISLFACGSSSCTFHHKLALIDNSTVILGSANWTNAAFEKNGECLLILFNLPEKELKKVRACFKKIGCIASELNEEFFE